MERVLPMYIDSGQLLPVREYLSRASDGKQIPLFGRPREINKARMPALGDQARRIGALSISRTIFNVHLTSSLTAAQHDLHCDE